MRFAAQLQSRIMETRAGGEPSDDVQRGVLDSAELREVPTGGRSRIALCAARS